MNDKNDHDKQSSSKEQSDQKDTSDPKIETFRLNNNIVNGYSDSQCCANCDVAARRDHMIAASLVYCDEEDSDVDDDCCIYTYRGDRQEPPVVNRALIENRSSSPLMDYLEMDFDPEPVLENESENEDIEIPNPNDQENNLVTNSEEPIPSCSKVNFKGCDSKDDKRSRLKSINNASISQPLIIPCASLNGYHNSLKEERNGCSRRNTDTIEVCQNMKKMRVDDLSWSKNMVWSEKEAAQLQINQIGVSACGATAIMNTLLALRIPFNTEQILKTVGTRLRNENAPLISYLESRSVAGCTADDLVRTLETVTNSLISARFFPTYANIDVPLATWLASWIQKGAVPILTLNRQRGINSDSFVPDSWHHQMVYGVTYSPLCPNECAQIYMTNPLTISTMESLRPQLFSPSVLMIKRADVLSRWTPLTDLMPLANHPNRSWQISNVLGQVVNLIREEQESIHFTKHIMIPASYKSGITLAMRTSSNFIHELKTIPDL
ncbi:uncharacterized protein LOC126896308 [Daktulosphaira vitifoliae]|uniref:uncharacterized protein LOC126896308 n=1 Tax=Daktulosphaira vitifoliae TaxID=58002 RepID=UPI0021AA9FBB|nr:uncharacterized protein LOC126896308 [Daktulosphaira vitifoliae]